MKKVLSLILAALIIFSCISTAFASDEAEQTCPVIHIPGFIASDIYADITDESTLISFPGTEDVLAVVTEAFIPGLIGYSFNRDTDKFVKGVTDRINLMFADWFNDSCGDAKAGSGIIPQDLTDVTATSELTFSYDWRSDPLKIANELHKYIETVCALSGSDKVALSCHSLGSVIALTYLTKHGNDRVSGMVFDSPACNGVALIGDILSGNVNLSADGIANFLKTLLGESEYKALVASIVDILKAAGVFELFCCFADEIIEALAPAVYRETLAPLLGSWLTFWAMVPASQVDDAQSFIFGDILKNNDTAVLQSKINRYNTEIRANISTTLKSFDAVGNFAVLSRYATKTIPLKNSAHLMGDVIIETQSTSLGATTAPIGDYFSDEYLSGKDPAYISPDKTVDASTCLFPEKTWFIKDSGHFETGGLTAEYYNMFLFAKEELTCSTAEIGRFTRLDKVSYTLVEDTTVPARNESTTLIMSIYNFVAVAITTLKTLIENKL